MGKHFYIGIAILAIVLFLSLGVSWGMDAMHAPSEKNLSDAHRYALQGNMDEAVLLAKDAYARWEKFRGLTACVADHTPMDETDRLFSEMLVYAEAGDQEHFAACCAQLTCMVGAIADAHRLNWQNLL